MSADNWGPWANAISYPERVARLRVLRLAVGFFNGKQAAYKALWLAESGEPEELAAALVELNRIPALTRRKIEDAYINHWAYKAEVPAGRPAPPRLLEAAG